MGDILFFSLLILLVSDSSSQETAGPKNQEQSFLQSYYLTTAPNRVAVCGNDNCKGSLFSPRWVFTTAECARELPVTVYHLHGDNFNCSNHTDVKMSEKRVVEKIIKQSMTPKLNIFDIAFLRLETPYDNVSHQMNFSQNDLKLFERWIADVSDYEPAQEEVVDDRSPSVGQVRRDFTNELTRKTPPFKVFATVVLLPFFVFAVIYFVISFFSRTPPKGGHVLGGYHMFGKGNGYEDTI